MLQQIAQLETKPLIYQPSYEVLERSAINQRQHLQYTLQKISDIAAGQSAHNARSVHVKSHGLIAAEMEIFDQLPASLAQGIFAQGKTLPLVMRFSTVPGDILHDKPCTPRSLAIKILGVSGDRLPGSEEAITQDFLLVNGASFLSSSVQMFLSNLKQIACTPQTGTEFRHFLSPIFRATAKLVESVKHGQLSRVKRLHPPQETNILGETYYSQDPILYGRHMAKIACVPVAPTLTALTGLPVNVFATDGLRKCMVDYFTAHTAVWELRVQLCTDIEKMPIEDATVIWPQASSPYIPVARITAKPQIAWSPYRSQIVDAGMIFSPWHGIQSHRPLGSVMRLRKMSYEMAKHHRHLPDTVQMREPQNLDDLC